MNWERMEEWDENRNEQFAIFISAFLKKVPSTELWE
jgi:hypothetical protein